MNKFLFTCSSVDSSLNALSAITWEDILKRHFNTRMTEKTVVRVAKLLGTQC
jgi:Na+/proline symporter